MLFIWYFLICFKIQNQKELYCQVCLHTQGTERFLVLKLPVHIYKYNKKHNNQNSKNKNMKIGHSWV